MYSSLFGPPHVRSLVGKGVDLFMAERDNDGMYNLWFVGVPHELTWYTLDHHILGLASQQIVMKSRSVEGNTFCTLPSLFEFFLGGSVPKSLSEHTVLYHTVFRKFDGFSMIINAVLKCYQLLHYMAIWCYLGCRSIYQAKPTGSHNRGFTTPAGLSVSYPSTEGSTSTLPG